MIDEKYAVNEFCLRKGVYVILYHKQHNNIKYNICCVSLIVCQAQHNINKNLLEPKI